MTRAHTCHACNCTTPVPPRLFMCVRHWRMLPKEIRDMVWAEYQPGQERLDGTTSPTDKYLEVTRYAIDWLEEYEDMINA